MSKIAIQLVSMDINTPLKPLQTDDWNKILYLKITSSDK